MRSLVLGAKGFLGAAVSRRLRDQGSVVADYSRSWSDLRSPANIQCVLWNRYDEIYQFAANMGGAGYLFTGEHDAEVMLDSSRINAALLTACVAEGFPRQMFFASSACVYRASGQNGHLIREDEAYPAEPESEYGWEKLFAERAYMAHARAYDAQIKIGRLDTIYGPGAPYTGGREKVIGALCRKVIQADDGGVIDIWGDGEQRRTFLYVDDFLDALTGLMQSALVEPVNIASPYEVTINELAEQLIEISGKRLNIRHVGGPIGPQRRCVSTEKLQAATGWAPKIPLREGLERTYDWIKHRIEHPEGRPDEGDSRRGPQPPDDQHSRLAGTDLARGQGYPRR